MLKKHQIYFVFVCGITFFSCSESAQKSRQERMKNTIEIKRTDSILIQEKYVVDTNNFVPHEHYEFEQ